ncbi:YdgA family protein [Superficieibacter sp. HKU1]|uniref:YdgA family protein n=1 Tax=Superficieibacter sp. HKU1 TaxID=3031919 RepID=UPI0023E0E83C|nr:YdgA family protein [Superficieibacter sp. HKU1]WES68381.1 YdgA family protein [Superficieibacter sp. HKU1]
MKKSTIAVGVIIALGVVWTGSAWYTGKQLEKNVDVVVNKLTADTSKKLGAEIHSTVKDFHRGLFSSHFILDIAPVKGINIDGIKSNQSLQLNIDVDHGPFPLARLGSGNILPAMASAKLSLVNNELTKPAFDGAKGKSPVEAIVNFAWDGSTSSDITLVPAKYKYQNSSLTFEGASYHVDANASMNAFSYEGKSKKITVSGKNNIEMVIPGMTFSGHLNKTPFDFMTGDQRLDFESIRITTAGKPFARLDGLSFSANADLSADNKKLNAKGEYAVASLSVLGQDFGGGKITLDLASLDAVAFADFMKDYQQLSKEFVASTPAQQEDSIYILNKLKALIAAHASKLKKGEPEVKWLISWKNEKGEAALNLDYQAADTHKTLDDSASKTAVLDSQLKYVSGKLVLPVDMAIEVGKKGLMIADHKSEESAKAKATQGVNGLVGLGSMFKLITLENNTVKIDVRYSQGYITLNGKKMTVEEFRQQYGRLGSLH